MTKSSTLALRPAERRDADDLLDWRNDPVTRAHSRNTGEVTLETHLAWLDRVLADRNRRLWIAERDGRKLGTVSAARSEHAEAEVSITVAPGVRGHGIGGAMLLAAVTETTRIWPECPIRAVVRAGNDASRRLFEGCGFTAAGEEDGFLIYRRGG